MSKGIPTKIDEHEFALAVIASVLPKGDSPESVAEEKLNYYLAAYKKAHEFNEQVALESSKIVTSSNPLERTRRLAE